MKTLTIYQKTLTALAFAVLLSAIGAAFAADMAPRVGTFTGLNNHITNGDVQVIASEDGAKIVLGANFTFDGAPDPKVALGNDGKYDPATLIMPLKSNTGEQTYNVPASIDVSEYNEVYIWCEKFSVGLGVATLMAP